MESLAISPPEESKQFLDGKKWYWWIMIFYIELKKHVRKYVWLHVRKYGRRNIRSKNFLQFSYIFSPSNSDIYWEVHSVIENKIISFPAPFFLLLFHCHSKGRWTCVAYLVWSPLVSLAMPWNNSSPFPLPRDRLVCCQLLGEKRKIDTNPHLTGKCSFIGADCRPNKDHRHHVHIP